MQTLEAWLNEYLSNEYLLNPTAKFDPISQDCENLKLW